MGNRISLRLLSFFFSLFVFNSVQSQNIKKISRAGILCHEEVLGKTEAQMADDNEHNRKLLCIGNSEDNHYNLKVFYHRGYCFNEIWGAIKGSYSINVYSTHIESNYPIECTHFNYAFFPNIETISFCQKYGIKELYFYELPKEKEKSNIRRGVRR